MCEIMETNKWLWQPHKNGPIYLRVSYRDPDGRRRNFVKSLETRRWADARRIRDTEFAPIILDIRKAAAQMQLIRKLYPELEKQLAVGLHGGYAEEDTRRGRLTLGKLFTEWRAAVTAESGNYRLAPETAQRYMHGCKAFLADLGEDIPAASVTSSAVSDYRDRRIGDYGKTKKTVQIELVAVRNMFAYAVEKHGLEDNPATSVRVRRGSRAERLREQRARRRRPPTHEEADAICTRFPGTCRTRAVEDFQDYGIVARYTGMRQGEIAHIEGADLQLYSQDEYADTIVMNPPAYEKPYGGGPIPEGFALCIYVRDTRERPIKTGTERIVPVAEKLLPVLQRRLEAAGAGPLFAFAVKDSGKSFGSAWVARVKAIHPELTMHGFRHYATSEMENNGVNAAVSSMVVGHSPGTVHDGYFHKTVGVLKEGVERIY